MSNQLKYDPTRTTLLRKQFMADMQRRFNKVSAAIQTLVVDEDCFGLITNYPTHLQETLIINAPAQVWRFNSDAGKVTAYRKWLNEQVNGSILTPIGGINNKPWTSIYIESAYMKGGIRAYTDLRKKDLAAARSMFVGGQKEFLKNTFSQSIAQRKMELLYTRAFTDLKGVTDAMGQQMSRILVSGLTKGQAPSVIARELRKNVATMTKTRANAIARTEVIASHAEGQLDSFAALGIDEVGVMAEWNTTGDDRVCAECDSLSGVVMTVAEAHGLIPRHTNCRCMWIPANVGEKKSKKQFFGKAAKLQTRKSVIAEAPKITERTIEEVIDKSTWAGKELIEREASDAKVLAREFLSPQLAPPPVNAGDAFNLLRTSDNVAVAMYPQQQYGLDAYSNALNLNSAEAEAMMRKYGLTKAQIYNDIYKSRLLQEKAVSTDKIYFGSDVAAAKRTSRMQLHDKIINSTLRNVQPVDGQANFVMTGGYPGDRTAMLEKVLGDWKHNYINIDSDLIKLALAKADGYAELGWRTASYQTEADMVVKKLMRIAKSENKNVLFNSTMRTYKNAFDTIRNFQVKGYNTSMLYSDMPLEKSIVNSIAKMYESSKIFVDPMYVASHGKQNIESYEKLKALIGYWKKFNVNVAEGGSPIQLEAGVNARAVKRATEQYKKMIGGKEAAKQSVKKAMEKVDKQAQKVLAEKKIAAAEKKMRAAANKERLAAQKAAEEAQVKASIQREEKRLREERIKAKIAERDESVTGKLRGESVHEVGKERIYMSTRTKEELDFIDNKMETSNITKITELKKKGVNESVIASNGIKGVFKNVEGEYDGVRSFIDAGTYYKREVAAYKVDRFIDMDIVPSTVVRKIDGKLGSFQHFQENAETLGDIRRMAGSGNNFKVYQQVENIERERVAFFDTLIGNQDRHKGNIMFKVMGKKDISTKEYKTYEEVQKAYKENLSTIAKDGKAVGIDNGLSFAEMSKASAVNEDGALYIRSYAYDSENTSLMGKTLPKSLLDKAQIIIDKEEEFRKELSPFLKGNEIDGVVERARWMLQNGKFPSQGDILEYKGMKYEWNIEAF